MAKNFLDKIGLAHYHEKIKELIDGNGEGIQELTSPVRLWDLEDGVYQLPASSIIYYYGSSNTSNSFTVDSTSILFVSKQSSYKYYFIIGGSSLANYLYYGYSISSSGTNYSLKLKDIKAPTSTLSQYNLGYYATTSTITNLNSTSYVNPGVYGMSINAGTGIPSEITSGSTAILMVLANRQAPSGVTYIRQDLYVPSKSKHWKRNVLFNASSYTYPDWEEVVEDLSGKQDTLVSGTNIKTINGETILGSGDISVGRQLTEIDGTLSIGALTDGVYLIRQGSVINQEYTIQNDTIGQVISYDTYKALLTVEGNTTWSNEPRNMKYTYDTTTSKIISVSVTSIHDSASINYVNNHTEVYNVTGDSTSVATATVKTIATLTIPAGNYIVNAHVNFASNATGVRKIYIGTQADYYSNTRGLADNRLASSHQATMSNISTILKVETDTTYYLNVYQNSGSTLSCAGGIRALRIGDYKEYQAGL